MATKKTHIAVYLEPAVEEALKAFCEQKGLKAKRGYMFSAGVNAALAQLFGISQADTSNVLYSGNNIPAESNISRSVSIIPSESNIPSDSMGNIPLDAKSNIPVDLPGNILAESIAMGELPGKPQA